ALPLDGANVSHEHGTLRRPATRVVRPFRAADLPGVAGTRARGILDRGADDVLGTFAVRSGRGGRSRTGRPQSAAVRVRRRTDAARRDAAIRGDVRRPDSR